MTKNITLAIDEEVLDKARIYAAKRQTSVNGLVREYLARVASEDDWLTETRKELKQLMENSSARMGPEYKWSREDTYADRVFPRHKRSDLRGDGKD